MTYLILTTIFFGIAIVFIKLSTNKIYPLPGNVFFLISAFVIQLGALIYVKLKGVPLSFTPEGIGLTLVGGIFIGFYTIFLFITLSQFEIARVRLLFISALSL